MNILWWIVWGLGTALLMAVAAELFLRLIERLHDRMVRQEDQDQPAKRSDADREERPDATSR